MFYGKERRGFYASKLVFPKHVLDYEKYTQKFCDYLNSFYGGVKPIRLIQDKDINFLYVVSNDEKKLTRLRKDFVGRNLVDNIEEGVFDELLFLDRDIISHLTKTL